MFRSHEKNGCKTQDPAAGEGIGDRGKGRKRGRGGMGKVDGREAGR